MSRSTTTTTLAGLFAAVALTACGGGGGGGDDGGGASPPPPAAPPPAGGPPVAADCSAFASGRYHLVNPYALNPSARVTALDIDTTAGTARDQNGNTTPYTADGGCQYTIDEGDYLDKVMVSQGGALVLHAQAKQAGTAPQRFFAIGLPEQTRTAADWAGRWNVAIWRPVAGTTLSYVAETGELNFDAAGQATASLVCSGLASCAASGSLPRMTASSSGGFDVTDNGAAAGRAFLYKASSGGAAFVWMASDGRLVTGATHAALGALPAVGSQTRYRSFTLAGNGTLSALANDSVTVTSVDSGANRFTRERASDGRLETLRQDHPRDGLRYRAPDGCSGSGSPCGEAVALPLRALDIDLSLGTATTSGGAFLDITVPRP